MSYTLAAFADTGYQPALAYKLTVHLYNKPMTDMYKTGEIDAFLS